MNTMMTWPDFAILAVIAAVLIWRLPADRAKGGTPIGYTEGLRFALGTREVLLARLESRRSQG